MSEHVDIQRAQQLVDEAALLASDAAVLAEPEVAGWIERVRAFSEHCREKGLRTHIAVLGTMMLAKAANTRVDVFSLKASDDSAGGFDARGVAEKALVPASRLHQFDLGARKAQPLNNQPFFRSLRINRQMVVREWSRPVLNELIALLQELAQASSHQAVRALAAFIHIRRGYIPVYGAIEGTLSVAHVERLADIIEEFVRERSDTGRRAQAVVGGLLDVVYGPERVRVGGIHEPDRQAPGDVAVQCRELSLGGSPYDRVFEVRDKPVPPHAVLMTVEKIAEAGVPKATLVAIAGNQPQLNISDLRMQATDRGVWLTIYTHWSTLVQSVLPGAEGSEAALIERAVGRIRARLIELEAPGDTVESWDARTLRAPNAAS
jgi:hypothetical protein